VLRSIDTDSTSVGPERFVLLGLSHSSLQLAEQMRRALPDSILNRCRERAFYSAMFETYGFQISLFARDELHDLPISPVDHFLLWEQIAARARHRVVAGNRPEMVVRGSCPTPTTTFPTPRPSSIWSTMFTARESGKAWRSTPRAMSPKCNPRCRIRGLGETMGSAGVSGDGGQRR
jgi:hypothetical protein